MHIVIRTATEVAAVGAGDPTLLEALRDSKGRGCDRQMADAVASHALWRTDTGADGAYLVHLYVNEGPQVEIERHLKDPIVIEPFHVPSGRLMVAGEEVLVGARSLNDYPHLGQEVQIAHGDYRLTAFRSEAADELLEKRFLARASADEQRAWTFGNRLAGGCVFLTFAALVAAYFTYLESGSAIGVLLPLLAAAGAWWGRSRYRRTALYRSAEAIFRAIELELPSIVLLFEKRQEEASASS
jgi:hypothetical protein